MNNQILAILIQEGTRLISESLKNRAPATPKVTEASLAEFIDKSHERLSEYTRDPEEIKPIVLNGGPTGGPTPIQINISQNQETVEEVSPGKASSIVSGCVPCALGHVGTCTGLLNESIRFSRTPEGMGSPEVVDRINMCLDELNAMERVDLRPEMLTQLDGWEKQLADQTLSESRQLRHDLEAIQNQDDLESTAAKTQRIRKEIGRSWFQNKLQKMPEKDKDEIKRRVLDKINEMATTIEPGE